MKSEIKKLDNSQIKLTISTDEEVIKESRKQTLNELRPQVKAPGFREGKAPDNVVEQRLGQQYVQSLVLERAVGRAFALVANENKLKTLTQPEIELKKFVPYSTLDFEATVEVVPEFKLPEISKLKIKKDKKEVTEKDIDEVIENVRLRLAENKETDRAAKKDDRVWIDFKGVRADNGQPVSGASGTDYPLVIGSDTFIKGFEPKILGMKKGDSKEFTVTFPEDYHVKSLQKEKVKFSVTVKKVEEVIKPKINDELAKKAGPFKTLAELRQDVRQQLEQENNERADRDLREKVVETIVEKTKFDVPPKTLDRVRHDLKHEFEQDLQYRGLNMEQYLEREGLTEEEFLNEQLSEKAVKRAKASLILTQVAETENLQVTPEELELRMQLIRQQYSDQQIQAELNKPESQRELAAQMLTEKTIAHLVEKATA